MILFARQHRNDVAHATSVERVHVYRDIYRYIHIFLFVHDRIENGSGLFAAIRTRVVNTCVCVCVRFGFVIDNRSKCYISFASACDTVSSLAHVPEHGTEMSDCGVHVCNVCTLSAIRTTQSQSAKANRLLLHLLHLLLLHLLHLHLLLVLLLQVHTSLKTFHAVRVLVRRVRANQLVITFPKQNTCTAAAVAVLSLMHHHRLRVECISLSIYIYTRSCLAGFIV